MQFSQKIDFLEIVSGDSLVKANPYQSKKIKASIQFNKLINKTLWVKVGISAVDMEGAQRNLEKENPNWDFEEFKQNNRDLWCKALNKVQIMDDHEDHKTIFYTALYHNLIVPNTFSDVDGRYRGMDLKIHKTHTTQYSIFSLWDTYRATHPLNTILEPKRVPDFIETFKKQFEDGGILPIWELAGNYTGCMIGYHAIPVIADAYFKGLTSIAPDTLLKMMLTSANQNHLGLKAYKEKGYIAVNDDAESVSKTLEYAYDDWCIAQLAKKIGNDTIYKQFMERAQSYKNLLDPTLGYMRPKLNETWKTPFDPSEVDFNYTEANSWQYSFYVPQDIYSFIDLLGGNDQFEKQLDDLFTASSKTTGREQSDISGLIGQYAHGNEPSHHMAYLYNYINRAQKSQNYIAQIMKEMYKNEPEGLCGNEDCGQMSAWYVFSAMGFYPVNPANGEYIFGKPMFKKCKIKVDNGKSFIIKKQGDMSENAMVKSISLNGKPYSKAYLSHADLMAGGELIFEMSKNETIQFSSEDLPHSQITDHLVLPSPSIRDASRVFRDSTIIRLEAPKGSQIFFAINQNEEEYQSPFTINSACTIRFRAVDHDKTSKTVEAQFYKIPEGRHINIKTPWHYQYAAGGNDALIDGLCGTTNFRSGAWQGYYYEDMEVVVDLGNPVKRSSISINFIQDARSWIWMPQFVEFWGSTDSTYFFPLGKINTKTQKQDYEVSIETFSTQFYPKTLKYIKIFAKNHNICPEGHLGEGGKGYIFCDEIIVH